MLLSIQTDLRALGVALFGLSDRDVALGWGWPALVLVLLALALRCSCCARACARWRS